jgi:hypothetical protein
MRRACQEKDKGEKCNLDHLGRQLSVQEKQVVINFRMQPTSILPQPHPIFNILIPRKRNLCLLMGKNHNKGAFVFF